MPNALSLLRLALAPGVGYAVATGAPGAALALFAAAGALDWADGAVARAWPSQASLLGAFLDPLADKALVACTALPLALAGGLHPAFVALVVGRDAALLAGSMVLRARTRRAPGEAFFSLQRVGYSPAPTAASKANTALQIAAVAAALAAQAWPALVPPAAVDALQVAAGATTVWTGVAYWRQHGHAALK